MDKKIRWNFTPSVSLERKFIDTSNEIFKSGKWAFLTREVIQNSLDALRAGESKLIMRISVDDIHPSSIPDRESIIKHLNGTLGVEKLPERCARFAKNAKQLLEGDRIRILKISDYNTTGITGSEKIKDEVDSQWKALIYDEGNSQKSSDTATGSFGTGKNAPFALSALNTVFYVTRDENNKYACQGVAKLFTSYVNGQKIEPKIYYAHRNDDGNIRPLSYEESLLHLSRIFVREEMGSDVIILGVSFDKEPMKREIIQSIVENFFVLLSDDKLEISVFDEAINKDTLWSVIDKYCDKPIDYTNLHIKYGYVKQYLEVYEKLREVKEFKEDVHGAGNLKLLIAKGNDMPSKSVAMFRNNGMKIFDYTVKTAQQNYSAIFFPGDKDVDRFLRKIENPTHDFFDPEVRIDDIYEKQQAIQRYGQIKRWIKQKIEEYTEIMVSDNDYLDGMEEYIQLDDSEPEKSVVNKPDIEIINYENKTNKINPMIESDTSLGRESTSDFKEKDGKSENKQDFKGTTVTEPGNEGHGLVKDYHNQFKFKPRIIAKDSIINVAISLENYNSAIFNIEIESVGEDDAVSYDIPKIKLAQDLTTGQNLNVEANKITGIVVNDTNVISIHFERKFESKYKVNVYRMRGENNEN